MTSCSTAETFREKIQRYFAGKLGLPDLQIVQTEQLFGGISRETWRVDLKWHLEEGRSETRPIILRLDPPASLLESGRHVEYAMYEAFHTQGLVPVPEPIVNEDDDSFLGMPFCAVSLVSGTASQHAFLQPLFRDAGPIIARQTFEVLGRIASFDYRQAALEAALVVPELSKVWSTQLDYWEQSLRKHSLGAMPVIEAAIRQLRRTPPPAPAKLSIVHGDYHFGNWMYSPKGIEAVIDWEMAHLGDPHEDLAWALLENWRSASRPEHVMHYLKPEDATAIWEESRGEKVCSASLQWWTLFSHVKACALWIKGAYELEKSSDAPFVYAIAGWMQLSNQEVRMVELIREMQS